MERIDITSLELRDYAISYGWVLVKEALKDGLFVLNSPNDDYSQLIFPKDQTESDFRSMAEKSLHRLSVFNKIDEPRLIDAIREVNDDVIGLRYYSDRKTVNSISFDEAFESIKAARQLLLSAASSVINPVIFHPKLNRTDPQEMIKKVRFRHTEEGSFVLRISCPFDMTNHSEQSLLPSNPIKPLSRNAFELINLSSSNILEAVDSASIQELFESESKSENPIVSYNLCDALIGLYDEERELPFQLVFDWSRASLAKFPFPNLPHRISFPYSHKEKLEEVKSYFTPQRKDISGKFFGSVETLDGELDSEDRRSGSVMLSIIYDNEILKARVNLGPDDYATAVDAHTKAGGVVQFKGDLKRGKSRNVIENISDFEQSN